MTRTLLHGATRGPALDASAEPGSAGSAERDSSPDRTGDATNGVGDAESNPAHRRPAVALVEAVHDPQIGPLLGVSGGGRGHRHGPSRIAPKTEEAAAYGFRSRQDVGNLC